MNIRYEATSQPCETIHIAHQTAVWLDVTKQVEESGMTFAQFMNKYNHLTYGRIVSSKNKGGEEINYSFHKN